MQFEKKILTVFNHTTTSYKLYWWLAILHSLKASDKSTLSIENLAIQMVCMVWYPINYFKISLGKQDQLGKYIQEIKSNFPSLNDDIKRSKLVSFLYQHKEQKELKHILEKLTRYVPFRFIRPWFPELVRMPEGKVNKMIFQGQKTSRDIPYTINEDKNQITINKEWFMWLQNNMMIIERFTYYELYKYVEKNNKNITNISIKLFPPQKRNSLNTQTKLWEEFGAKMPQVHTIFEHTRITKLTNLSIDHFLPWSFLTHNELWNLHPMEQHHNSSKSNKLPSDRYLDQFSTLQHQFITFLSQKDENLLDDYCSLLNMGKSEIKTASKERIINVFEHELKSKFIAAQNMGFESDWYLS